MPKPEKVPKDFDVEVYNKEQRWWKNIEDNCTASIKNFEDSIKLQKCIKDMASSKIKEFANT